MRAWRPGVEAGARLNSRLAKLMGFSSAFLGTVHGTPALRSCRPALLVPRIASAPILVPRIASAPIALAPSGIDGLPLAAQTATVAGIFVALGLGSTLLTAGAQAVTDVVPPRAKTLTGGALACLLGAAFIFAGYAHFAFEGAYTAIYPPQGTWGFWYLPGSAEFHVSWTGGAEALGGLGLLLGGLGDLLGDPLSGGRARPLRQLSASALFLLMVAVFPANIYQYTHLAPPSSLFTVPLRAVCSLSLSLSLSRYYTLRHPVRYTHGAIIVGLPGPETGPPDGPLPLEYHYVRLVVQIVLVSLLSVLSKEEGKAGTQKGGGAA